jgi:hypothetical protein
MCQTLTCMTKPKSSPTEEKWTSSTYPKKFKKKSTNPQSKRDSPRLRSPCNSVLILIENDDALLKGIIVFLEEIAPKNGKFQHPLMRILISVQWFFYPKKLSVINGKVEFVTCQSRLFGETDVYPEERTINIQVLDELKNWNHFELIDKRFCFFRRFSTKFAFFAFHKTKRIRQWVILTI